MSKHLKEVFASRFQVSFLETVQPEPCNVKGTMDIIVEELNDDGSPWTDQATRFVKVCHSRNECTHYEIVIDPETGIGKITLQEVQAMKYVIVQVDECGNQMVNGDDYDIHYTVNDEMMQEDYAQVSFDKSKHVVVRIMNRRMQKASLTIHKSIRDHEGVVCSIHEDMEFLIRITRGDCFERFVKLNVKNQFQTTVNDLCAGVYTIEEYEYCDYQPFYKLNDSSETRSTQFELLAGNNTLEIMNEQRIDTQLTIEKYVRDACGELSKPSCFEEFEIHIISDEQEECIILCEENDFSASLYGLAPGFYDIREVNCDTTLYETSYMINGCEERRFANVEVCVGKYNEVWVINTNVERSGRDGTHDSPLRICKYIRRSDGCVVKPDDGDQFKVMVSGCGSHEAYYLNCNNNFCIDMASLCIGEYEIQEISCGDYITSYRINGGREKTSACLCYDGSENFCVEIINEERNRGHICVSKYIRNEFGDLCKPNKSQCFTVSLSSYFCKHCFELNEENDFTMCFHDLRFGSYEVREEEVCDYETSYQVNCERERRHARFTIDNGCEHDIKIINSVAHNNCGILKINKFIETASKELVKPSRDEEFEVMVEGPCFAQRYMLRAANNWCIQLEGLSEGEYHIQECENEAYETSYLVNRECVNEAFVYMGDCNQEVCIVNKASTSGNLTLHACVRTCDGDMIKPANGAVFEILIEGSDDSICVCLHAENNWCVVVDELCEGKYRIIQKDNMGYKVSYFIHGREESFGKIRLGCQDEEVSIINEETACTGSVVVTKYMMDEEGNLCEPCPQDEFHFELRNRCFCRTYTLRNRNDFCIYFDDLDEGEYEICELDEGFDVSYRINGECFDHASFLLSRDDVQIDIINTSQRQGALTIEKRIRKGNALVKPCPDDHFQILLKGRNCHELYELHANNDFTITLCGLNKQHYEIKELGSDCNVSYDVDGCIQEDGYVLYDDSAIHMTIINEERLYGCMELNKVIESEHGERLRPNRYDCFEMLVESESFKQKVILNRDNDFCARLYDLPQGHYEVKELNNDCYVSFLINDLPYESACVDICEEDVCITIINHPCALGTLHFSGAIEERGSVRTPQCDDSLCLRIQSDDMCKEIELEQCNDFMNALCDLKPGSYHIIELGKEPVRFEIEDQCFQDDVCVELNGEDVCINVVRVKECGVALSIHKCIQDCYGNIIQPDCQEVYEVMLMHDGECKHYTLNKENHFTQNIANLQQGSYEIKECGEHDVTYQVNEQCMQKHGRFEIGKHDMQVMVLNHQSANANLHVESRIMDCGGRIIKPYGDMTFTMLIRSDEVCEKVILNERNAWHAKLLLEEGCYQIEQEMNACFDDVYYLVNDEKVNHAIVNIRDEDQSVTAINEQCFKDGSIEICKLIRDMQGEYHYPDQNASYIITIKSQKDTRIITLNATNHFYASVKCLCDGWYEIIEESGGETVEYIVNNAAATHSGMVHVCGNANTVNIINPQHPLPTGGSIELTKYIASDMGMLLRPTEGEYRIHVSKPEYNEIFYLNVENDYHMVISDLEDGLYVVDEVDHEGVTYIVNGGSVTDRASVRIVGNANHVDIINPEADQRRGQITMAKYIRQDGQLIRPSGNASYVFLVSRPGFHQLYTLDSSNQWMMSILDLEDGDYVISETTNSGRVSFIINGSSEVDRGVVNVQGNSNTVQIINTMDQGKGSIHIEKYIREGMKLRRPSGNFTANIFISKPGYNESFVLNSENDWMLDITDLDNGLYVIDETASNDEVSYIINGGSEVRNGVVNVDQNSNMVMMIDTMNEDSSSIQIAKFIRNGDGTLITPNENDSFQVEVNGDDNYHNVITLNATNQWNVTLSNLNNGYYEINEISNQGYTISYIVDNGLETSNASVRLLDNAHTISIINATGEMMGRLEISKMIKRSDGTLMEPADGDLYFVEISNDDTLRRIQLDSGNMFTSVIQDLPQGEYRVREVDALDYLTTYRVNGGPEQTAVTITMASGVNNTVEVLNELRGNQNVIEVFKYMLDSDGNYLPPTTPDVYQFMISGIDNDISQTYELNVENSWNVSIRTLPSGVYQIKELQTSPYPIKYIINSADLKDEAIFNARPGSTTVVGIINQLSNQTQGTLVLTKRLRDPSGNLSLPTSGESFTITVSGQTYNQIVTLDAQNNYTFTISDIAFGIYNIEEVSSDYMVSYVVNEGAETNTGIVNINSTAMNVVMVVNTPSANTNETTTMKRMNNTVRVVIE